MYYLRKFPFFPQLLCLFKEFLPYFHCLFTEVVIFMQPFFLKCARPVFSQYFLFVLVIQKLSYNCSFLRRVISFFFSDSMSTLSLNILNCKDSGLQLYQKRDSGTNVFLYIWKIFKNTFSYRTSLVAASAFIKAQASLQSPQKMTHPHHPQK